MTELEYLKTTIHAYRQAEWTLENCRENMRRSVRTILRHDTKIKGDHAKLARKLKTSPVQLSNLKGGHSAPSADWAEKLVRVCERNGI